MTKVETVTGDVFGAVSIVGTVMVMESFETPVQELELSKRAALLGGYLLNNPNVPANAYTIKRSEGLEELDVSKSFKELANASRGSMLEKHWIAIGRSSSTWYGFLDDDSDINKLDFAEAGIDLIEADREEFGDRRTDKRLRPFYAYKTLIVDGENERFFTRDKKLAGAGAVILSIGAVSTIYLTRHFKHD